MEFDKSKGFCNGLYIKGGSCEFTFHLIKHAHDEVNAKNCKRCTCPPAKGHKRIYAAKKREMVG
jgi:hypothetical protein